MKCFLCETVMLFVLYLLLFIIYHVGGEDFFSKLVKIYIRAGIDFVCLQTKFQKCPFQVFILVFISLYFSLKKSPTNWALSN